MKTTNPLALAFLLAASAAAAQPFSNNGGNLPGGVYTPGATPGMLTDPAGAFGATELLGTRPDVKWARADCQRIPCKTALQQRMEDQKKLTPNDTIVDMGDGESFGIISTDDKGKQMISIDNGMSCGMPRALTDAEQSKFAAQIAKGDAQKADAAQMDKSINGDKSGMKINADNTQTGADTSKSAAKGGASSPTSPDNTPSSGYQDGANMMAGLGDSSDSSGMAGGDARGDAGGASGAIGSESTASTEGSSASGKKAIPYSGEKARQEAEAKNGYEFLAVGAAAKGSTVIGAGVNAAFTEGAAPVAGRLATPPTSSEQGKMQFGANGPAPADAK